MLGGKEGLERRAESFRGDAPVRDDVNTESRWWRQPSPSELMCFRAGFENCLLGAVRDVIVGGFVSRRPTGD